MVHHLVRYGLIPFGFVLLCAFGYAVRRYFSFLFGFLVAGDFEPETLYLLVAIGGALGSVLRFWLSGLVASHFGSTFPWGTFIINVTGSFIIGFYATLTGPEGRVFASGSSRQFFMTGVCGGYTTFSSFSLQTLNLARDEEWLQAGGNVVGSVVACLVAVWLGHAAAAYLNQLKGA